MIRFGLIALIFAAAAVVVGCGGGRSIKPAATLPSSGRAYRALDAEHRSAVAAGCRDRAAAHAAGNARRQLQSVDPAALRSALDDAFTKRAAVRTATVLASWPLSRRSTPPRQAVDARAAAD